MRTEDIPEGCETYQIPGSLWAQFVCRGPLPDSLQSVNTKIWSEWLPALQGYELAINGCIKRCGNTQFPQRFMNYTDKELDKID